MTSLVRPDARLAIAWSRMMDDFGGWQDAHGAGYWVFPEPPPYDVDSCAGFVSGVLAAEGGDPIMGQVPNTHFWVADGEDLVGFLHLRHELNDFLRREGGHIGYSVRPSRRRQGHASRALALAVEHAAAQGISPVLVTCDDDNLGSIGTIERCGGVLEDVVNGKRRYWI